MHDALSRKTKHSLNTVVITYMSLLKELERMGVKLVSHRQVDVQLLALTLQPLHPSLVDKIQLN